MKDIQGVNWLSIKRYKWLIIFLTVFFFMEIAIIPICEVNADTAAQIEQKNREKKAVQDKLAETRLKIQQEKAHKLQVARQLNELDYQLNAANSALYKVENNLSVIENQIGITTRELERAERDSQTQYVLLRKRVRAMYSLGIQGYASVILSATSYSDFVTRMNYLSKIIKYDNEVLAKLKRYQETVTQKRNELKIQQNNKTKAKADLNVKKNIVSNAYSAKNRILSDISKNLKDLLELEEKFITESNNIAKEILKLQTAEKYAGGSMAWPAPGYYTITSSFGMRLHPILKVYRMHTGIDIGAQSGANIVAANAGKVMFAGYNSSYGNYIIIDHGGKIATVYAHSSRLLVKSGTLVNKGTVIAKVGSTGSSTGSHLHFEVRVNGSVVNPLNYLK